MRTSSIRVGAFINDVTHFGGRGICQRLCYSISLFSKMGDKGEGGVKNIKKMGDVNYGRLLSKYNCAAASLEDSNFEKVI